MNKNHSREGRAEDDIIVSPAAIKALFNPPLAKTTFHDRAKKGAFASVKGFRGYYLLNKTRKKLGMPPVDVKAYLAEQEKVSEAQLARQHHFLALTMVVPEALDVFASEDIPETLTQEQVEVVQEMMHQYLHAIETNEIVEPAARLAFVGAALKALHLCGGL